MTTVASKVPFSELAGLLEKISKKQGADKKLLLQEFINRWRDFHRKLHADDANTTDSFYSALRLLLPHLERERAAYGIKENTLAKLYIEVLCLGKDSPAADKLIKYRAPKNAKGDAGDFATVAYFVLKPRCPEKGSLTIEEVNQCLDGIATNQTTGKKDLVRKNILHLLRNLSALEQKWLIRMIMKELKCGLSQQAILNVFHPDANEYFNVTTSLEKVCANLKDPSTRMHEIEISVGAPFHPMLGELAVPKQLDKIMEGKMFYIEIKFDGERMQLHKKDDEYMYFSRNGHNYSRTFGENPYDGNLTPYIANCFKPGVKNCILDGEMVGIHPETKIIRTKGENFDIKSDTNLDGYQPCLCVFDILLLNDRVLSNLPLRERKEILKDVFNPVECRMFIAESKEATTSKECLQALNDAIDKREEGIMVKNPDSVYKPSVRKGGWYKIKPEYVRGLGDDLDVLVVGGYFGVGARGGLVSHFLCAVAEPFEPGEKPSKFRSFCRVGSGYSRKELFEFNRRMQDKWLPYSDRKGPPSWLILGREKPSLLVEPSKSTILQIKASEITSDSDKFGTGCTLRFPRVEKIRSDKPWHECLTYTELKELQEQFAGKLAGRHADEDHEDEPIKKKRKVIVRQEKPSVAPQFRATDTSQVKKVSELFEDKEFCVVNGSSKHSKASLEKKIVEYGGTVVQHPGPESFCVLCDKVQMKVKNIISTNKHDVVKLDWLVRCIEARRLLPWVPSDMLHARPETEALFKENYDDYGDSYTEDTTVDQLMVVFKKVQEEILGKMKPVSTDFIAEIENKYFVEGSTYGLFRLCRVYLDDNTVIGDKSTHIKDCSLELTSLELRMYGATLCEMLNEDVTHVVLCDRDLGRIDKFRDLNRSRWQKFHIVRQDWVSDCIDSGKILGERGYEPA